MRHRAVDAYVLLSGEGEGRMLRENAGVILADCPARLAFDIVSNTWNAVVIWALKDGPRRHSELREQIGGISAKVLTETLRRLEEYGLVTRGYELTGLGRTLLVPIEAMGQWAYEHGTQVAVVR